MNRILTCAQLPTAPERTISELIQRVSTLYTLTKHISYLQLFASFINDKEMMKLILCGKNYPHKVGRYFAQF